MSCSSCPTPAGVRGPDRDGTWADDTTDALRASNRPPLLLVAGSDSAAAGCHGWREAEAGRANPCRAWSYKLYPALAKVLVGLGQLLDGRMLTRFRASYKIHIQMTKKSIHTDSVAGSLITSRARLAVLKLLLLNAGQRFYLREIAERTGQPVRAVQLEVARLEASGLLESEAEGRRKYYRANRQAPVFPDLRTLLVKTIGLGDLLKEHVQRVSGEITVAFLYGSYPRGEDKANSDIDLMVVGSISGRALSRVLSPARESLAREINSVVLTESEFRKKLAQDDHFLLAVLGERMTFLIGGPDDLERLAETRPTPAAQDKP
jgi:predicted nucleotidyltransferase/predicted transcriptional regulator